ncbi:MAG: UDP-N-acetylmuramoyl-tripeptide--D-alanyl-D-alanine ligase [Flavobacteriales bacterium]|nr:UDP-N-acetylmuramoyl-tripeptide--D-alanyl-D-alanine ligase [Flavobacteriales bacterium]MCC6576719.1 UDP-N-acetylmuramoyl-tripeptide--D-alanyl-D-alanine ligase [Flavobacteriales bacterium]
MTTIAQLHAAFLRCTTVCTDTRALVPDSLFVALQGPSFNANHFAAQALEGGCRHAVVDDPAVAVDDRYLLVPDTLKALQDLARHHRRQFNIPCIGITGTNGKTTTKELVHAVLSADRPTLATSGNLNNHIGVPLTLLKLKPEHRIAIIEMGASKPGDIAELCAIAEPTHGLITNIGKAHLEGFGSLEGVVRTKTELYTWLREHDGTAFVNGDDALLMEKSSGLQRSTYGTGEGVDTRGNAQATADPCMELVLDGARRVRTRLIGNYNAPNALAAVCIGRHFGVPDEVIAEALADYTPANNRSQFKDTGRNHLVLDAYNANPTSMAAALENFARMCTDRKKLAILGDMLELGEASSAEHRAIVALVDRLGLESLFVGAEFMQAGEQGRCFADVKAAAAALVAAPPAGLLILVKGSRGIHLEEVVGVL